MEILTFLESPGKCGIFQCFSVWQWHPDMWTMEIFRFLETLRMRVASVCGCRMTVRWARTNTMPCSSCGFCTWLAFMSRVVVMDRLYEAIGALPKCWAWHGDVRCTCREAGDHREELGGKLEEYRPQKGGKRRQLTPHSWESFSPTLAAWNWWSTGSWCSNAMPVPEAPRRWWSVWVGLASASSASLVCKYHFYVSHNPDKKSICTPRSDVCSSEGLPVRPCGVQRWRSQIGSLRCPAKTFRTITRGPSMDSRWITFWKTSSTLSRCRFNSHGWEPWRISCSSIRVASLSREVLE